MAEAAMQLSDHIKEHLSRGKDGEFSEAAYFRLQTQMANLKMCAKSIGEYLEEIDSTFELVEDFADEIKSAKATLAELTELLHQVTAWREQYEDSILSALPISSDSRCIKLFTNPTFVDVFSRRILVKFTKKHHFFPVEVTRYAFTEDYLRAHVWEDDRIKYLKRGQTKMPKAFVTFWKVFCAQYLQGVRWLQDARLRKTAKTVYKVGDQRDKPLRVRLLENYNAWLQRMRNEKQKKVIKVAGKKEVKRLGQKMNSKGSKSTRGAPLRTKAALKAYT